MRFLIILIICCLPLGLVAKETYIDENPDWVEVIDLPDIVDERASELRAGARGGIFLHMVDTQAFWDETHRHDYYRVVQEVTDRAGLETAATIQYAFDPVSESVTLTRLEVIRDGTRIDLRDRVEWEVYRRETRLEAGIIDGSLTGVIQVPGLRTGDLIDYSIIRASTPFFPGADRSVRVALEYSDPALYTRHVANWPSDWPFFATTSSDRISHQAVEGDGITRHIWDRRLNLPPRAETDTPVEAAIYGRVQYSDTDSWAGVVEAFQPYYTADYPLTAEWEERVDQIMARFSNPEDRAIAALRLVQDEIRYVSLSVGAGGYLARHPSVVVEEGFGDCKDKSLLLVTMLNRMGIQAEVALTDLDAGHALASRMPSLSAFDHMIVRVVIGGTSYWLDATSSHQGGSINSNVAPDVGFALPLGVGAENALVEVPSTRTMAWLSDVHETFDFSLFGVMIAVETRYTGAAADYWRYELATSALREIDDGFLDFYRSRYPGLERLVPLSFEDGRNENLVSLRERYFLPAPALFENDLRTDFGFGGENYASHIANTINADRQTPYLVGRERIVSHRVDVRNAPIDFIPPDSLRLSNPAFLFTFSGKSKPDGGMTLNWMYRTKARIMAPEDASQVLRHARDVGDNFFYSWSLEPDEVKH